MSDLDVVRDWVGSKPDDAVVLAEILRCGTANAAALSILRRRLADLEAGPSTLAAAGDVSYSYTVDQVQGIRAKIARLEALLGLTPTSGTAAAVAPTPIVGPGNPR